MKFVIYGNGGIFGWSWVLTNKNGKQVVCESPQSYSSEEAARKGISKFNRQCSAWTPGGLGKIPVETIERWNKP